MFSFKTLVVLCTCFALSSPVSSTNIEKNNSLDTTKAREEAINCVQRFGTELVELLSKQAPFSDVQQLVQKNFDMNKMAQHCCPLKYKLISPEQRDLYEERFSTSVCKAYHNILKKYYTPKGNTEEHFKIDASKSKCYPGRGGISCTVVTDVFASNGARISVKWLSRGGKIENFVVEGTDMRAAKKRDMKTRYKQSGSDFTKFLENILESSETA
ncbi:ABC transporter substrate-binding protein [Holospora curviuscula]|uniref:Toluene tolerance, Ttg2 n=1 Tax=Holospora curviuscula TaxID=1082868 RepID=A0A2S5R7D5_9PROT|nr:ABC transporter substrate-binding protein [Holospora curviuscula]PPE03251.1 Toluene tolerance, Ttg2 [Holospora curviuscula]